ncbi:MAG: response regulator transcription factor [Eubacterium sp.]|nr:response regulator transcription factor [Eubacterium sp.]
MNPKILIVDDEPGIVAVVQNYFEAAGYRVIAACSGTDAMKYLTPSPDIVLLDINMPDLDGLTVCQNIREHITCPILFLTARVETADKIKGFSVGADDYIVKPFDLDELGARVAAHLRRENRKQGQSSLRFFGDMVIDYTKREIAVHQKPVVLSKKEFDIVALLSAHAGQVFDRERIYEKVWGLEGNGNSDTIMEHIRKIRSKFAAVTTHGYIETVWGVGYKWNGSDK